MEFYRAADIPLATFLANALPNQQKWCSLPECGEGPGSHMVSYLHSKGLVTFTITQLPEGKELPGGSNGNIWFWARPTQVNFHGLTSNLV